MSFDLETFLPYRLHQAAERSSQQFHRHYKDTYGLNRSEWRVLFHIGSYAPISATKIALQSRLDKALVSRALAKLEKEGWVERSYRDGDRRGHDLALTKAGKSVFEDLRDLAGEFNRQLEAQLGAEAIDELLQKLKEVEAAGEAGIVIPAKLDAADT